MIKQNEKKNEANYYHAHEWNTIKSTFGNWVHRFGMLMKRRVCLEVPGKACMLQVEAFYMELPWSKSEKKRCHTCQLWKVNKWKKTKQRYKQIGRETRCQ